MKSYSLYFTLENWPSTPIQIELFLFLQGLQLTHFRCIDSWLFQLLLGKPLPLHIVSLIVTMRNNITNWRIFAVPRDLQLLLIIFLASRLPLHARRFTSCLRKPARHKPPQIARKVRPQARRYWNFESEHLHCYYNRVLFRVKGIGS